MNKNQMKRQMVDVSRMAFVKGLTAGTGGNVSWRLDDENILITPHKCSLGFLNEDDILTIGTNGEIIEGSEGARVSTEIKMHLALYKEFDYKAIIHLHPPYINTLVAKNINIKLSTYESSLILGGMPPGVPQSGPTVTDTGALIKAFRNASIVILENHGIVAAADNLIDAFSLADVAEDAAKTTLLGEIVQKGFDEIKSTPETSVSAALDVFTDEHMSLIQTLINNDEEAVRLGMETDLTVCYAIKQTEDGKVYNMHFEKGRLVKITNDLSDADFINNGKKSVWINIFNGRLDPFAATSQKKLRLEKGHIGDLSRWYAPFYRIFALWKDAPVKELDN
jgi:L-fuculose-phosphate aldolase